MKLKLLGLTFIGLFNNVFGIIRGINYYGIEVESGNFVCSWVRPVEFYVDKFNELGFNAIRVPFSHEYVKKGDFSNLDRLFNAVKKYPDMKILLDYHRTWSSHQSYKPDAEISLNEFKRTWITIIQRYVNEPSLEAIDIFNEYQGGDVGYLNWVYKDVVQHIEWNFPNRLIYNIGGYWWGGTINGVSLEDLPFNDRIIYSIHRYHFSNGDWNNVFGSMPPHKINVGEFGWVQTDPNQVQWAYDFLGFLKSKGIKNTYFWTVAHSSDTSGIWEDDCINIQWNKYNILKNFWKESEGQEL